MTGHYILQNPPHVRARESSATVMGDMMIAMLPLYLMAFYYYGARVAILGAVGVGCAFILDVLTVFASGRRPNLRDLSAIVTGMLLPLLMPASVPIHVLVAAVAVAIVVVKFPFGGVGNNLFNPAAVGFAFVAFCWPAEVFTYPVPLESLPLAADIFKTAVSPAYSLKIGAVPDIDIFDMLLGSTPGPMGATSILVIIAVALFLIIRRTINWRMPLFFLGSCAIFAALFPRIPVNPLLSVEYELFAGSLFFGAVFVLTEPVTSPKRDSAKILYAVVSGIVVMLFRRFGGFEQSMMFALVIMNVLAPLFDLLSEKFLHSLRGGNGPEFLRRRLPQNKKHAKKSVL